MSVSNYTLFIASTIITPASFLEIWKMISLIGLVPRGSLLAMSKEGLLCLMDC